MRLLVLGANGLLGSNVVASGIHRDWSVVGTYHSNKPNVDIPLCKFDISEWDTFESVLEFSEPDIVVNCAAMTNVDECEERQSQANLINCTGPAEVATICAEAGIDFVQVSTDYVFDGTRIEPYEESAEPNPIQVYGMTKLAGEQAVREVTESVLIPRLSFVWGVHRSERELTGFPAWVRGRSRTGDIVTLFTDQWVTPTRAGNAAETILELIGKGVDGVFHVACTSCVTPHEFGKRVLEEFGANPSLVKEGQMSDVERKAVRPSYTCLAVEKVETTLGRPQPTLMEDIEATFTTD